MPVKPEHAVTVYGPEVMVSGLKPLLDRFIGRFTGLSLAARFFAIHDAASITDFYGLTSSTSSSHWPLVVDLFDARPCCVSIWEGTDALVNLQVLKGATQPCQAKLGTVRAGFWCDNPVANLLHVSDNDDLARQEFQILERQQFTSVTTGPEDSIGATPVSQMHNGLFQFSTVIRRLAPNAVSFTDYDLDPDATKAATKLVELLLTISQALPRHLSRLIHAFLSGDHRYVGLNLHRLGRITAWEKLMIESAMHSNPVWLEKIAPFSARPLDDVWQPGSAL